MMAMTIPFTKMVAAGNDFLLVDTIRHPLTRLRRRWAAVGRALCDRRAGVGADGLLVLERSARADARMRVFNPDGTEAQMCGNGACCVARYERRRTRRALVVIETIGGRVEARVRGDRVRMRMPDPQGLRADLRVAAAGRSFRVTHVNTGVPHAVVPVERLDTLDVARYGRALRRHRAFAPQGANVDFVRTDGTRADRLRVRTYERGVEAETPACGTGATAAAVAHAMATSRDNGMPARRRIHVETHGGEVLTVSCAVRPGRRGRCVTDVALEGTARVICHGTAILPLT